MNPPGDEQASKLAVEGGSRIPEGKKAKQELQGTKKGEIELKCIISTTHNTLPQSRSSNQPGGRRRNEEKQRKNANQELQGTKESQTKASREAKELRVRYLEEETGPSARGGRIGRGDGGGAATMLASMEPWSTGGDG